VYSQLKVHPEYLTNMRNFAMNRTYNMSKSFDYFYTNKERNFKQKLKIQSKVSKLESAFKLKMSIIKTKCNDDQYQESCYDLWCEIDDIANHMIELNNEMSKYDHNDYE